MALNWEKLQKLQSDYSKPKYALAEVTRQLKKRPSDPYLLAWKAATCLSLGTGAFTVAEMLRPLCKRQPPITDAHLLGYIYHHLLECLRRHEPGVLVLASAGNGVLDAWQSAAKALPHRDDRLRLWSGLFVCAMKADCWEDVRYAVQQAKLLYPKTPKSISFTFALANMLAVEKKEECLRSTRPSSQVNEIQWNLAYGLLKQAFDNVSKAPQALHRIENMRDLRFLCKVWFRQKRAVELYKLLSENVPLPIQDIIANNLVEIKLTIMEALCIEEKWEELWHISSGQGSILWQATQGDEPLSASNMDLLVSWKFWGKLLVAADRMHGSGAKASTRVWLKEVIEPLAATSPKRDIELTRIALTAYAESDKVLPLCKAFWQKHGLRSGCFRDIRRFVDQLGGEEQRFFLEYISQATEKLRPTTDDNDKSSAEKWMQAEVNVLKFTYMLILSQPAVTSVEVAESYTTNALRIFAIASNGREKDDIYFETGTLAIMGLLVLHQSCVIQTRGCKNGVPMDLTSYPYLLQAGLLTLYMTACESGKQDRPLLLLSTRIHLYLGLGTLAFDQYQHARVKEMLKDTVSYILLSGISLTHPFATKGPKGWSAADELRDVIKTLTRMENKLDDFLYADMQDFSYDQALDLLDLKRKLRYSTTKQLALLELRRLTRLVGETVDAPMELSARNYQHDEDNRDMSVLPNFESCHGRVDALVMPDGWPGTDYIYSRYATYEISCRLVYKESTSPALDERMVLNRKLRGEIRENTLEKSLAHLWEQTHSIIGLICNENIQTGKKESVEPLLKVIATSFQALLQALEEETTTIKQCYGLPINERAKPIAESIAAEAVCMPYERGLKFVYSHLEVLQAAHRLPEFMREHLKKNYLTAKQKAMFDKTLLDRLDAAIKVQYNVIHEETTKRIKALKNSGTRTISAQASCGPTGEALKDIIGPYNLSKYAASYAESAIQSLEGVLQVKLKR